MHSLLFKIKRFYRKEKLPDPLAYLYKWFGITPAGVLQIGANCGQEIKRFAMEGIQYGIFVEPLHKPFQQLASAVSKHHNYIAINALCASESGLKKTFYISSHGGISSSILKPTGHLAVHPEISFENEMKFLDELPDAR